MNLPFEFLIPKRPVSHQAKNRENLQSWKEYVYGRAYARWKGLPLTSDGIQLTLVYLCNDNPADVDNIIKPIQDALVGIVFADDKQVTDVDSHRRYLSDRINIIPLPRLLQEGVLSGEECVYVHISFARELEFYLC